MSKSIPQCICFVDVIQAAKGKGMKKTVFLITIQICFLFMFLFIACIYTKLNGEMHLQNVVEWIKI